MVTAIGKREVWAALLLIGALAWSIAGVAGEFEGYLDVGAREVSVSGDEDKYRQHINLDDGVRLFGAGFRYRPAGDNGQVPDLVDFRASGLGGDPYQSISLQIREYGRYRVRYERQESDYFYQDLLIDPATFNDPAVIEGARSGDFHHFDFERVRDTLRLDLDLTQRATLNVDYHRYEKSGDSTTVYDVSREEFELERPIDEVDESISVGLTYEWDKVTVAWTERFRDFDNASSVLLPGFSEGSEPGEPTELDFYFLDQPYDLDGREHQLRLLARPTADLEVRFDLLITDLELDLAASERAQGVDFTGTPFASEVTGASAVDRDTELYEFAVGYAVTDRVRLLGSARRNRLDQNGTLAFSSGTGSGDWDIETDGFEVGVEAVLTSALHLGAGWATEERNASYLQVSADFPGSDDFLDAEDIETERDGYYVNLSYRPDARLSVGLTFEDDSIDDPFTLASPTDSQRVRLRGRYRWNNGTTLTASYRRTELENETSDWQSDSSQTNVRLTHTAASWNVSLGASWVDLDREIEQLAASAIRQDLFVIDYEADASFIDASARWQASDWLSLGGSFRSYDNDGSFSAERDDVRAFVEVELPQGYNLNLGYRNVDFAEDDLESFDVDVWELKLGFDW